MNISTKLTLSLTTIGFITFISYGSYNLSIERQDLAQENALQTQLLGKSLQIAIEHAIRDKQLEDIEELLKALEHIEADLKVRVYDRQGDAFPDADDYFYSSGFQSKLYEALKKEKKERFFFPVQDPEYIGLLLPLKNKQGEKLGVLAVARTLKEMRRDLDATRHDLIISSVVFISIAIVQQLLEFTRRRPPSFSYCDLRQPVNAVLNLLEYEAVQKQVKLSFETVDDLPLVFADSDGIQQIVLNLITNALSATASGGCIVVAIVPIIIQNKAVSDGVQLTIRDNGCGIPPDVLQHVFEPFFTTRHQQGGVGLGLAVARSIVIAHNGTIKAERSPGLGSTISIFLPAKERQHAID